MHSEGQIAICRDVAGNKPNANCDKFRTRCAGVFPSLQASWILRLRLSWV